MHELRWIVADRTPDSATWKVRAFCASVEEAHAALDFQQDLAARFGATARAWMVAVVGAETESPDSDTLTNSDRFIWRH